MKRTCALVVLYTGEPIDQNTCDCIITDMGVHGIIEHPRDVTIRFLDAEDIADALIKSELKIERVKEPSQNEQIIAAIAHIGKVCHDNLILGKTKKDYTPLAIQLLVECNRDELTRKSVEVIARSEISLKKEFMEKYNFSQKAFDTIRAVFHSL